MPIKFEVLGVPVGKGRPKFSTVNGHAVAYTPAKTANYELTWYNDGERMEGY